MNTCSNTFVPSTRRQFLQHTAAGFGWMAFAGLCSQEAAQAATNPSPVRSPHFTPKAKRVIFMFMQGGPSHLDTFDWKPELARNNGKEVIGEIVNGKGGKGNLLAPQFEFTPHGQSGMMISSLFPNVASHADDICMLNGMFTSNAAHPQASIALHTGSVNFVRPSMGAWVVYGLGTENHDLPGFVTINPIGNVGGAQNYGSAFLPASFQGTRVETDEGGIANIRNRHLDSQSQREQIDLIQSLNRGLKNSYPSNPELEGVIESYELAYRMQTSVPATLDLTRESAATRTMYGLDDRQTANFGRQCLMARRLAEAGVRFIQVTHTGWDQHNGLKANLTANCRATDQPIAALLTDLKQRGMLEDTLVVWGGEFGRSPEGQSAAGDGRRHNNNGYSMWMVGGGVKGGMRYGSTDETGGTSVDGRIGTHDLHATMLHLLGMDHQKLTYRFAGRDFRLTDIAGEVVKEIVA